METVSVAENRFGRVIGVVARNHVLARLLLAYLVMIVAEFGEWLAVIVYAYIRGGASAAGLVAILQLIPSMLLAPLISAKLAHIGVARLLAGAYAAAAATLGCCGVAILAGAPVSVVYLAAMAFSLSLGVGRPLHHVLMPLVVRHPDELTSANIATSWSEGVGALVGPVLAGVLISADGPGLACTALAGLCVCTPLLAHVRPLRADAQEPGEEEGGLSDLLAAARVIFSRPNTRALIAFPAGAAAIEGAIDLLVVVLAVRILAIGPGAAGYLSAAFGAGGLLGATIAVLFAGRRLALPLAAATLIGGLALGALALASTVLVAVLLLVLVGAARTMQSITAQTLLQRSTPLDVIVCAFALIESMRDLGMAFSALIIPLLIGLGGAKAAFLGMASFALIVLLATARRIRRIDSEASIPVVEMGLLRNIGIFSALPAAPLETLAREAHYVSVHPGTAIISEGEEGDSYYAITHGSVRVTKGEGQIRQLGIGDGFGEIALLYPVRRTATV
ncbi:MAG TPA: cyclic nucleotide-binding domain-containing protein, partial [Solirubrobacteraceae bacterium]|nr:cyclic nucleotide-binding domain-containing protein [Solirubrobacteraceae bacterium]